MYKKIGKQTITFNNPPVIIECASTVGPKEGEGPLASYFDSISGDAFFGTTTWEKAESKLAYNNISLLKEKARVNDDDIDFIFAGDLLNQSMGSSFGMRDIPISYFGIFGACSTMGEGLILASCMVDGGFANHAIASASSHFCAAEKTFRFPLELGTQRVPTSSWTVTGDGAALIAKEGNGPRVTCATVGKILDMGINDVNNMGAAMAPAAFDTIKLHFEETGRDITYYDIIATGDLGHYGRDIVVRLGREQGMNLRKNYTDCGILIFDKDKQDTHAGGSGCGCSATVFAGYLYKKMRAREINKVLLVPTGALHNTISSQQGETIPAIAHAVAIENV